MTIQWCCKKRQQKVRHCGVRATLNRCDVASRARCRAFGLSAENWGALVTRINTSLFPLFCTSSNTFWTMRIGTCRLQGHVHQPALRCRVRRGFSQYTNVLLRGFVMMWMQNRPWTCSVGWKDTMLFTCILLDRLFFCDQIRCFCKLNLCEQCDLYMEVNMTDFFWLND